MTVRVKLPLHLQRLTGIAEVAGARGEVTVEVSGPVTQRTVFDALERGFPMLSGTVRDRSTGHRRSLLRIFACGQDFSHEDPDTPLPDAVASGAEPVLIVGAIAGG